VTFAFPDLKRPQYPSSPEILLSSLAWSVIPRATAHRDTGLIYHSKQSRARRKVRIEQTMPYGETLQGFLEQLSSSGMRVGAGEAPLFVAEAVAEALLGAQPQKGVGMPSSAIGMAGALLQDPVGGLAVANPPNFAHLLNTMFKLGGNSDRTAAELWFEAAAAYASQRPLRVIEAALAATSLAPYLAGGWPPSAPEAAHNSLPDAIPQWWQREVLGNQVRTPFSWFRTSWERLCSPPWREVLPPRRWSSWAICVLRNALGFGFLWESNFYFELARGVADSTREATTVARWALRPTKPLVPHQQGGIAQMDVMPSIKQLLAKGLACRNAICKAATSLTSPPGSLAELLESLRRSDVRAIKAALEGAGDTGGLSNLVETVRYSLLARGTPEVPDNSSLLRAVSRNYTHVIPGPEWIVVMAAMSAQAPSETVRLGDVRNALDDLGFKPRVDFLLTELERAGLCASAPDGDEGIELNLGF
jgi:hypothetical protein